MKDEVTMSFDDEFDKGEGYGHDGVRKARFAESLPSIAEIR